MVGAVLLDTKVPDEVHYQLICQAVQSVKLPRLYADWRSAERELLKEKRTVENFWVCPVDPCS